MKFISSHFSRLLSALLFFLFTQIRLSAQGNDSALLIQVTGIDSTFADSTVFTGILADAPADWMPEFDAEPELKYQSLLWEITGKGMKKPSYLYGTMHVSDRVAYYLGDSFFRALKNVQMVALESDPAYWLDNMRKQGDYGMKIISMGSGDFSSYGSDIYRNTFSFKPLKNTSLGAFASSGPDYTNFLMYRRGGYSFNYQENTYLDMFIYQTGLKYGKKVTGLEDFEESEKLARESEIPDPNEKIDPDDSDDDGDGRSIGERIEEAYRNQDLDLLDSLNRKSASKKSHEYMIVKRNRNMVIAMDTLMQKASLFAGVGAAHLPGTKGMIEMLREMGYTVRPVKRIINARSKKTKETLDEQILPVVMKTRVSEDKEIECSLPGPIIEIPGSGNAKSYLCPDFTNGAYYSITRKYSKAALFGVSPQQMRSRMDSQLFENIPGKIISQKNLDYRGYPALDVLNKKKTGEYERRMFIFTPLEMIVIFFSGPKDYAKRGEVQTFFKSVNINFTNIQNVKQYKPEHGGYATDIPGNAVIYRTRLGKGKTMDGDRNWQSFDPNTGNVFMLQEAFVAPDGYIEEDTFENSMFAQNLFPKGPYKLVRCEHKNSVNHRSIATYADHNGDSLYAMFTTVEHRYYLLLAKSDAGSARSFFGSFSTAPMGMDRPFESYTDTFCHFTVEIPKRFDPALTDEDRVRSYYRYSYRNNREKEDPFDSKENSRTFYFQPTGEMIFTEFKKFHRYRNYENSDSFWKKHVENLELEEYGLRISKKVIDKKDGTESLHMILSDTGSAKVFQVHSELKNGALWQVIGQYDSIAGPGPFTAHFFKTFRSSDSLFGPSVYANKTDSFFKDISSADSMTRVWARKSAYVPEFRDADAPALIDIYKKGRFDREVNNMRGLIISELGHLKHESIVPFLEKIYRSMSDTPSYQMAVLNALSKQKSKAARDKFSELIRWETPLTGGSYYGSAFYGFFDSLELAPGLFPGMFALTRYPEYKGIIYGLLSEMLDSNLIKPAFYATEKNAIFNDAYDDIRRFNAQAVEQNIEDDEEDGGRSYVSSAYEEDYREHGSSGFDADVEILEYANLLYPSRTEELPARFFRKVENSPARDLKFNWALFQLDHKLPVKDTTWNHFAKDRLYLAWLYRELKERKKETLIPDSFRTQFRLTEAFLFGDKDNYDPKMDTLVYLGRRTVTIKGDSQYVYFWKMREKETGGGNGYYEDDNWQIEYSSPQPTDTTKFNDERKYRYRSYGDDVDDDEEKIEKYISRKLKEMMFEHRHRYRAEEPNDYYSMRFGGDEE